MTKDAEAKPSRPSRWNIAAISSATPVGMSTQLEHWLRSHRPTATVTGTVPATNGSVVSRSTSWGWGR